jgi:hypothetical protein
VLAEKAALREQLADLKADLAELQAKNDDMGRVFEADGKIKAALAEGHAWSMPHGQSKVANCTASPN